jgi:hypothetical protein
MIRFGKEQPTGNPEAWTRFDSNLRLFRNSLHTGNLKTPINYVRTFGPIADHFEAGRQAIPGLAAGCGHRVRNPSGPVSMDQRAFRDALLVPPSIFSIAS